MKTCFLIAVSLLTFNACVASPAETLPVEPPAVELEVATPTGQAELITPVSSLAPTDDRVSSRAVEHGRLLAARVNDQPIFLETFEKQLVHMMQALETQNHDPIRQSDQEILGRVRQQVLMGLIDQLIIEQQAHQLKVNISDRELEDRIHAEVSQLDHQAQFEAWLTSNNLTYNEFRDIFRSELLARQLFEQITANAPQTADQIQVQYIRVKDEATARLIIEQLKSGADFNLLAQEYSSEGNVWEKPGSPGWIVKGLSMLPAEVETIAFSLQPGQMNGPIPTPDGFYIIKLINKEIDRPLTEKTIQTFKNQIFTDWLAEQRSLAVVERFVDP